MKCPNCNAAITSANKSVVDTRPAADAIRRRRTCRSCGHKFTTFEVHAEVSPGSGRAVRATREQLDHRAITDAVNQLMLIAARLQGLSNPPRAADVPARREARVAEPDPAPGSERGDIGQFPRAADQP